MPKLGGPGSSGVEPMTQPVFLYLHIPKTAGSAVISAIREHFLGRKSCEVEGPDYLASEARLLDGGSSRADQFDLVTGHFSYGLHRAFARPCHYYAIVRDPVDRLISLYYFTKSTPAHPRYSAANDMSLMQYALSGIHPEIENCQTKMLSGRPASNFLNGVEVCSSEDIDRAIAHLDSSFVSVGVFEHLELSLRMLTAKTGWPNTVVARQNVTLNRPRASDISDEERRALESVNRFDLILYRHALDRLCKSVDDLPFAARSWLRLRFGSPRAQDAGESRR